MKNLKLFKCFLVAGLLVAIVFLPASLEAAEEELLFTVLHTNDEHGAVIPHSPTVDFHPHRQNPSKGGYARLATAVEEIRQEKEKEGVPLLLLSAGDYIGGSVYNWLAPRGYTLEFELMHLIGYDAAAIGNHEFDYGPEVLADYLVRAGYPAAHEKTIVLCSNMEPPLDHLLATNDLVRPRQIFTLDNGLKVGVFALLGEEAVSYTTAKDPVEFSDQHQVATQMIKELKEEGAEVIVALTHSGVEEDLELAKKVPGIHLIVGAHCHTALHEPLLQSDTLIVQTGSALHYLGHLDLAFDREAGKLRLLNDEKDEPVLIPLDYRFALHEETNALIEEYTVLLNELIAEKTAGRFRDVLETVMFSSFEIPNHPPLKESPLGDFVTDAMRLVAEEKLGHKVDFAISANGTIRGTLTPGTMPHALGQVSVHDLADLVGLGMGTDGYPGYSMVAAYLTGEEVRRALEVAALLPEMMGDTFFLQFSGLRYSYNPQNAILFTVPVLKLPLPTTKAVLSAERYIKEGRQEGPDDHYVPIERGDETLYCLVTDAYILSFLPMVGDLLPSLEIVVKDSAGEPVEPQDFADLAIKVEGGELKVWAALLEYAASLPVGESGLPEADDYYSTTSGRINQKWSVPYLFWLLLALSLLVFLVAWIWRRKAKKKARARH